jgi:hypothetical protein
VLAGLRRSDEARRAGVRLPGLALHVNLYLAGRIPLLGSLLRWVVPVESESPLERRVRSLEAAVYRHLRSRAADELEAWEAVNQVDRLLAAAKLGTTAESGR